MPFSRGSSQPRDWTWVSCVSSIGRWVLYHCAPWKPYGIPNFTPSSVGLHLSLKVISRIRILGTWPVGLPAWGNPGEGRAQCSQEEWLDGSGSWVSSDWCSPGQSVKMHRMSAWKNSISKIQNKHFNSTIMLLTSFLDEWDKTQNLLGKLFFFFCMSSKEQILCL